MEKAKTKVLDGWMDGWMDGCKSHFNDCLLQSNMREKLKICVKIEWGAWKGGSVGGCKSRFKDDLQQ